MSFLPGLTSLPSKVGGFIGSALKNPLVDAGLGAAGAYFGLDALGGLGGASDVLGGSSAVSGLGSALGAGASVLGPMIGSALSGGEQLAAAGLGAAASYEGSVLTNKTNVELQQQQEAWQANMANTAYQRATADMKAAGLNPMLAYSQGGAATPNVQPAVVQNALGGAVQAGQNSAQAFSDQVAMLNRNKVLQSETDTADAESRVAQVKADRAQWEKDNLWPVEREKILADKTSAQQENDLRSQDIKGRSYDLKRRQAEGAAYDTPFGMFLPWIDHISGLLHGALQARDLYQQPVSNFRK